MSWRGSMRWRTVQFVLLGSVIGLSLGGINNIVEGYTDHTIWYFVVIAMFSLGAIMCAAMGTYKQDLMTG